MYFCRVAEVSQSFSTQNIPSPWPGTSMRRNGTACAWNRQCHAGR